VFILGAAAVALSGYILAALVMGLRKPRSTG
jgi:hypothetical protein